MRGPTRRALLASGLAAAAGRAVAGPDAAITDIPDWTRAPGPGVDAAPYGLPSIHEADVVRRTVPWLTADTLSAVNFTPLHALEGTITPNGLCFERHHAGAAQVDPAGHRLMLHGMVDRPLIFTMEDLRRFPRESHTYFLECANNGGMEWAGPQLNAVQFTHGMIHNVEYTGVPLRRVLEAAGLAPAASWLLVEGADAAGMTRSLPLDKALDDCLLAFAMNGEPLRPENGYPLRLVVPGWEGNLWIKWLRRIEVGRAPWMTREETSRYTDVLPDGRARQFTYVMEAKSVITSPSPERPAGAAGPMVISGLAWSGHGRIEQVDVSLDGGVNWRPARIGPGGPKALHRFWFEHDWDGSPMLLQSRAVDSTGYVQPTKEALRAIRGVQSGGHMNGIQTWAVAADGSVENVEIS